MNKFLAVALACITIALVLIVVVAAQSNGTNESMQNESIAIHENTTEYEDVSKNNTETSEVILEEIIPNPGDIDEQEIVDIVQDLGISDDDNVNLKLHVDHKSIRKGDDVVITAFITRNGLPVVEDVEFLLDGETHIIETDKNGQAVLKTKVIGPSVIVARVGSQEETEALTEIISDQRSQVPDINVVFECDYEETERAERYPSEVFLINCYELPANETHEAVPKTCKEFIYQTERTRIVKTDKCIKETKRLVYEGNVFEYGKLNLNCGLVGHTIECDEICYQRDGKRECGDGDGDGKCESGETCHSYHLEDGIIDEVRVSNGIIEVSQ